METHNRASPVPVSTNGHVHKLRVEKEFALGCHRGPIHACRPEPESVHNHASLFCTHLMAELPQTYIHQVVTQLQAFRQVLKVSLVLLVLLVSLVLLVLLVSRVIQVLSVLLVLHSVLLVLLVYKVSVEK